MADGNIVLTIDADTGEATKNVEGLEQKVDELGKRVTRISKQIDRGFKKLGEDVGKVQSSVDDVAESIDVGLAGALGDLRGQMDATLGETRSGFERIESGVQSVKEATTQLNENFGNFGAEARTQLESLDPGFGQMIDGFKGMTKGVKSTGNGFSFLGKAVAASGLGLLLTLLGSLVAYFKETEEGAALLEMAMSYVAIPMKIVGTVAKQIGEALVFAFTSPQEAMDRISDGFIALKDYVVTLIKVALTPLKLEFLLVKTALLEAAVATKEFFGGDATALRTQLEGAKQDIVAIKDELIDSGKKLAEPFVAVGKAIGDQVTQQHELIRLREKTRKQAKAAAKQANALAVREAEINKAVSQRQGIIDSERSSHAERLKALEEQAEMEQELLEAKIQQAKVQEEILAATVKTSFGEDRIDAERDLADAIADRLALEQELNEGITEYQTSRTELYLDEVARRRDIEEMLGDIVEQGRADTLEMQMKSDLEDLARQKARDLQELRELNATKKQILAAEKAYQKAEKRIKDEYAQEILDQNREINEQIRDVSNQYAQETLAFSQKQQMLDLQADKAAALEELNLLGATQEQKNEMREAFAKQEQQMLLRHAEERHLRERELQDVILNAQMEGHAMGIALMNDFLGQRQLAEQEMAHTQRMATLLRAEEDAMLELEMLEATEAQKAEVRAYYLDQRLAAEKENARSIRDIQVAQAKEQFDVFSDAGAQILGMVAENNRNQEADTLASAKRQFERNKKLQKAQAVIAGAQGVVQQLAVPQDTLTGANFVKAAMVAAATAFNVSQIDKTTFDSSRFTADDGSSSVGGDGGVQINAPDLSFLNRDAEESGPLRAFVVNQDVQNSAMQQSLIENKANFT